MKKKAKFKAIIDRPEVFDCNGNMITKEALQNVVATIEKRIEETEGQFVIPILLRFDPTKIVGTVHKIWLDEETGGLKVEGTINLDYVSPMMRVAPQYMIIKHEYTDGGEKVVIKMAKLNSCGLTDQHSNSEIPPLEIVKEEEK